MNNLQEPTKEYISLFEKATKTRLFFHMETDADKVIESANGDLVKLNSLRTDYNDAWIKDHTSFQHQLRAVRDAIDTEMVRLRQLLV